MCHTRGRELARRASGDSVVYMAEDNWKVWGFAFQRGFLASGGAAARDSAMMAERGDDNADPCARLVVVLIMQHSPLPRRLGRCTTTCELFFPLATFLLLLFL